MDNRVKILIFKFFEYFFKIFIDIFVNILDKVVMHKKKPTTVYGSNSASILIV